MYVWTDLLFATTFYLFVCSSHYSLTHLLAARRIILQNTDDNMHSFNYDFVSSDYGPGAAK